MPPDIFLQLRIQGPELGASVLYNGRTSSPALLMRASYPNITYYVLRTSPVSIVRVPCAGTAITAVQAARVPPPAAAEELGPDDEEADTLEAARARMVAAKRTVTKAQAAYAARRFVRKDLQLRSKVSGLGWVRLG